MKRNDYEYGRGIIVGSIIWLGFIVFMIVARAVGHLIDWAFSVDSRIGILFFLIFMLISILYVLKIIKVAAKKLSINRFKYWPDKKMRSWK